MRYLFTVLVIFLFHFCLHSQSVLWSAEIDVLLTTLPTESGDDRCTQLLRRPTSEAMGQADKFASLHMGGQIMQAMLDSDLTAFADPGLADAINVDEVNALFSMIDTVYLYDPVTFEESVEFVENVTDPFAFTEVGVKFRLNYMADGQIEQEPIYGYLREPVSMDSPMNQDSRPAIYFPIKSVSKPLNFNKRKWNMIDQHVRNVDFDKAIDLPGNQISKEEMIRQIFDLIESGRSDNFVSSDGRYSDLSASDRAMFRSSVDTVITFDPVDFSQQIEIIENETNPDMVNQIRLVQYWGWNAKKAELSVLPIGYSPILTVVDIDGEQLYDLPLFYYIPRRFRE